MIIRFERNGGFAAIPLRVVIDTTSIEPGDRQKWRHLIDTSGFFQLPAKMTSPAGRNDGFIYNLTVEATQGSHTVEVSEANLPETLQPIIDLLLALARNQRQSKS